MYFAKIHIILCLIVTTHYRPSISKRINIIIYSFNWYQLAILLAYLKNLCKQIVPKIIHFLKQEPYEM